MPNRSLAVVLTALLAGCTGTPAPMAGVPAADDPAVLTRGPISQTSDPVDLAIDGDAYFVLARTLPVRSIDDLVLTRDGDFHFEFRPGEMPHTGTYRLINADGLAVMSWRSAVDPNVRPFGTHPEEASGTDLSAFKTVVTNGSQPPIALELVPMELDLARNPEAPGNQSFDKGGTLRLNGGAPHDLDGREANFHVVLAKAENPAAMRHQGGGYLAWTPAAGKLFVGVPADSRPGREVGKSNTLTPGALERLPLLTPSRYDRERYPDALDPKTALPAGEAAIKGALVTAVQPTGGRDAPAFTIHLVALANGAAGDQRWTVTMRQDLHPVQRRGDILRPVVRGGLARGALVDVWTDAANQVQAIVLDRDDRPDAGVDAFGKGWL